MSIRLNKFMIATIGAMTIFYFLPEKYFSTNLNDYSYCIHKQLIGIDCPGCGFIRATYYFIHMDYIKAIRLNASVIFVFPIVIGEILYQLNPNLILRKIKFVTYVCFCISLLILYLTRIFNN